MKQRLFLLSFLCILLIGAAASAAELYVSPKGNDANPGTIDKPFASVARARDAARELKAKGEKSITVILRGGRYNVAESIVFDEKDSGEKDQPVVYKNYSGEEPALVGGIQLTDWQPYKGKILKAFSPYVKTIPPEALQLLEDGSPSWIARSPNEGWFRLENPICQPTWSFCCPKGTLPEGLDLSQLGAYVIQMGTYFSSHIPVTKVDTKERRLYTEFKMGDPFYNLAEGKTFILENALGLLDAPGEFYADHKTGYIYYWPKAKDVKTARIELMTDSSIISFTGKTDKPVHDITLEGLRFEGSLATASDKPQTENLGQIYLSGADRITIRDCRLFNSGTSGVALMQASTNATVTGCEIAGSGINGVYIRGEYDKPASGKANVKNYGHIIHNNYMHNVSRLTISGCGICMYWSGNKNTFSHNLLTDMPKAGVLMFSMWDMPREYAIMNDNVIKNNEFARCGTSSWDGGAFYIGATTENNTFENNRICDVWSWFNATWPQPEDRPEDDCSVDFDPGLTYNTHIRNNICYGENATTFESGRFEDETLMENNYFESPNRPGQVLFNGVWTNVAPFDASKVSMDIGLTSDYKYPYPKEIVKPVQLPLACSFEGTLSPFFLYRYSDGPEQHVFTTQRAHDGKSAFTIDKDVSVIRYRNPASVSKKVTVWFYDDPSKKNALAMATLRGPAAIDEAISGLGVDTSNSKGTYVVQEWGDRVFPTNIKRKAGWHELTFDVKDPGGCVMSIDGQQVGRSQGQKSFYIVDLGDSRFGSDSTGLAFDSVSIQ